MTAAVVEGEASVPPSTAAVDPGLDKYRRMQRVGIPEGAIRQAMEKDGVDAELLFGQSSASQVAGSPTSTLMWTRISLEPEQSDVVPAGSIWNEAIEKDAVSATTAQEVTGLFSRDRTLDTAGVQRRPSASSSTATSATRKSPVTADNLQRFGVLNRGTNVLNVVTNFNYKAELLPASLATIRKLIPNSESGLRVYRKYKESDDFKSASDVEQDFVDLMLLPRVTIRMELLKFALGFDENFDDLEDDMRVIQAACATILQSDALKRLLVSAFSIVRFIEAKRGSSTNAAVPRLSFADVANLSTATAPGDSSYSLLDYALELSNADFDLTAEFTQIWSRAGAASRVQYETIGSTLNQCRGLLVRVEEEMEHATGKAKENMGNFMSAASDRTSKSFKKMHDMDTSIDKLREVFGIPQKESPSKAFEDLVKLAREVLERAERPRQRRSGMPATSEHPLLMERSWW